MAAGLPAFASAALSVVFLAAAVAKFRDLSAFRTALGGYRLLPERYVSSLALTVPSLELACAALVWTPMTRQLGAVLATVLLAAFSLVLVVALVRHEQVDCGCFGTSTQQQISGTSLVRNVLLAALALAVVLSGRGRPLIDMGALLSGVGTALLLLLVDQAGTVFRRDWIEGSDLGRGA